ncbi:TetR/AcrR family transcriptional regulator [Yinghuangia sp. YIM S09857]|uniref:TetR/AcrR family transcriptional regulator n=1 Tax=Yinghuangia sp. YIM S09857 TaxID=3436929 RepID=UPI003F53662E
MERTTVAATRLQLIAAAERLFAERGINGVSVREIAVEAGQRNTNAVRYHFGAKEDLVDAIFEHRMAPINARRMALIESHDRDGREFDPYAVAEAFTLPMAELLRESGAPSWYLRFCVQATYTVSPDAAVIQPAELGERPHTQGLLVLFRRAGHLTADVPELLRAQRWHHFCSFVVHALADRELRTAGGLARHLEGTPADGQPGSRTMPFDLFVADLVDSATALLTAPVRAATRSAAARTAPQRRTTSP